MSGFDKEDSYKNLERINYFISNADTKTSFVLALVGVFILVFFTSGLIDEGMKSLIMVISKLNWAEIKSLIAIVTVIPLVMFLYMLLTGILKLASALTAKGNPQDFKGENLVRNSRLFFGTIASMSFDDFKDSVSKVSEDDLIADIESQTYINAHIAVMKFQSYNEGLKKVKWAMVWFIVFTVFLFVIRVISN